MKYYEVRFHITATEAIFQDTCDLLTALAGEAGFETFEETDGGLTGYVQQSLFQSDILDDVLSNFPIEGVSISYEVNEAEDRDWNEQWEQEGFEPIVVDNLCVVHDGRHFGQLSVSQYPIAVEIDAHLAFGTGTHETTYMMLASLLGRDVKGTRVLDCGCGTGILGIAALKAGAKETVGYDIDEWSADNARHNAVINLVDEHYTALLGDASVLKEVKGTFDIVLANINRNILLADMPAFAEKLKEGGTLMLSGFYTQDKPMLVEKGLALGLRLVDEKTKGEWHCLVLQKTI